MATSGHQVVASGDYTNDRFNRRYWTFVSEFVDRFEKELIRNSQESRGVAQKESKRFLVVQGVGLGVGAAVGLAEAGSKGGRLLARYLGTWHHAKRANAIYENLGQPYRETVAQRAILVEAATDIFRAFETQFTTLEATEGEYWHNAVHSLAEVAVQRILDHCRDNPIHDFTADSLTRAFLGGKPKFSLFLPKVRLPGGITCTVTELYDDTCLLVPGKPDRYYKKRKTGNSGYRQLFPWEDAGRLSDYKEFQLETPFDRSRILGDDLLAGQKMVDALDAINQRDSNFKLDSIHEGVKDIHGQLVEVLNEIRGGQNEPSAAPKKGGIAFELDRGPDTFVGRSEWLSKDGIYRALEAKGVVALVGPAGVGKSELARAFAARYKAEYGGNVAWIDCAGATGTASFRRLAKRVAYADAACDHVGSPACHVHAHYRDARCLFVFDDVRSWEDVESLLPCGLGPRVLITSRDPGPSVRTLTLHALTEEEALDLVRAGLNGPESDLRTLVTKLHSLPIALQVAVAYIKVRETDIGQANIVHCLAEIDCELRGNTDDEVLRAVVTLSLNWMGNEDLGEKATRILEVIAFFSPADVLSNKIFSKLMMEENRSHGKKNRELVIRLLDRYSMISLDVLSAVRNRAPIQETVRRSLSEERFREVLASALELVRSEANERHVVSVWGHAIQHRDLVSSYANSVYGGERNTIVHVLAMEGHHDMLRRLLKSAGEVNARNKSGNTALHLAARHGHLEVWRCLEDGGAEVDARNDWGRTPVQEAAFKGQLCIVQHFARTHDVAQQSVDNSRLVGCAATSGNVLLLRYLADRGADCWARDDAHCLPIHAACRADKQGAVVFLLGVAGANVDARDGDGNAPIHVAAGQGYLGTIRALVESWGADVMARNRLGKTAAHAASKAGKVGAVRYLVGCQGWRESNKYSLLHEAAYNRQLGVLEYLVGAGGAVEKRDGYGNTPLHEAAVGGGMECVRYLVGLGVALDARNAPGKTALHKAAGGGHLDVVRYLVEECGRSVDVQDRTLCTPLHEATYRGCEGVVRYLVEAGADVEARNNLGRTPLYGAVKNSHDAVMRYLVEEKHCLVDVVDQDGKTLLHKAAGGGHLDVVRYLVEECGRSVDVQDGTLCTPLHEATYRGCEGVVRYLVGEGADVEARNNYGRTPLYGAVKNPHDAVMRYLVEEKHCLVDVVDQDGKTPLEVAVKNDNRLAVDYLRGVVASVHPSQ